MPDLIRKNYRIVNVVVLGLCLYGLALPLLWPLLNRYAPDLFECPTLTLFGTPCPLCGMTRAAAALLRGDYPLALGYNRMVVPAVVIGLIEVCWRVTLLFAVPPGRIPVGLIKTDLWLHGIATGGYLLFGIGFMLRMLAGPS